MAGGTLLGKQKREADSAGGLINTTLKVNHATGGVFKKYEAIFSEPEITIERTGGTWASKYGKKCQHWDIAPPEEYFTELFRVSKNQIIWGGNYFGLPPTRCFVVWRKSNIPLEGFTMSPVEYAWTSFNQNARMCEYYSSGGSGREERFHPTQKPVALYEWLLSRYAKPGDKILDTHVGSASSLIACHRLNHPFVGFEIDKEYYGMASKRLEAEQAQLKLFG